MKDSVESKQPEVSVVVPTIGTATLSRVLDGLERQSHPPDRFEVIVVSDHAEPNPGAVHDAIGSRPYPVRRLTGQRPGASSNRNVGWCAAEAPLVLFIDDDTIPVTDLLSEHLAWHGRFPQTQVAVLGHVRWAKELRVTPFMRWLEEEIQFDYSSISGIDASWSQLYTANCSIKRAFIEKVGGFDEERLPYGYEDLDWAYRASKDGLRVMYNRRAVVDHLRTDMTLEFWKKRVRRIAASEYQFVQIHPELEPWFYNLFSQVSEMPPARGRGARLARFVPSSVPWLGPRVWKAADVAWKQALAPDFLEAWELAASGADVNQSDSPE
jgi:GT2 family glycosyltransferase